MAKLTLNGVVDESAAPDAPAPAVAEPEAVAEPAASPAVTVADVGATQAIGSAAIAATADIQAHAALSALESALHDVKVKLLAAEAHISADLRALFDKLKSVL